MTDDIGIVTAYFNPCRYKTKKANFDLFVSQFHFLQKNLLIAEMALGSHDFELDSHLNVLRLRGNGVLWQKERLLNLAIARLPTSCKKIVWLDCDLLFEDFDWLRKTSDALDQFVVVQPFSTAVRLPRGHVEFRGEGQMYESFARVYARDPLAATDGAYEAHGHTGFAWAARYEILDACGLYDACLTGSGDHLMAHVFAGALSSKCIPNMIGSGHKYALHFQRWAEKMDGLTNGSVGYVDGRLLHLWHGEVADKRYRVRNQEFKSFNFDPDRDIRRGPNGLWEWDEAPISMRLWADQMFESRKEDGEFQHPST